MDSTLCTRISASRHSTKSAKVPPVSIPTSSTASTSVNLSADCTTSTQRTERQGELVSPLTPGDLDGTLALRRHAYIRLPNVYLELYGQHGNLPRHTKAVTGFFEAAFGPSFWSSLDPGRGSDAQTQIAADCGCRLAALVAADPQAAARTRHRLALEIERTENKLEGIRAKAAVRRNR